MNNNGSDNFLPGEIIADGLSAIDQIEISDLDLDGDLDIVAASSTSDDQAWMENDGSENFLPHGLG